MYPLRQAGQQLQGHGRTGLHREMPARGLFRQALGLPVPYWPMNGKFCIHQKTAIKRFL